MATTPRLTLTAASDTLGYPYLDEDAHGNVRIAALPGLALPSGWALPLVDALLADLQGVRGGRRR